MKSDGLVRDDGFKDTKDAGTIRAENTACDVKDGDVPNVLFNV